jgi:hypothetical protein
MKRCPTCNRDYTDESLSYCLDDGSPLATMGGATTPGYDPNATLVINTSRPTDPDPPPNYSAGGFSQPQNPTWELPGGPPKRSNLVWWVLGISGGLVIIVGGIAVLIGVIGYASLSGNSNNQNERNSNNSNQQQTKKDPVTTTADDGRKLALKDDFSEQKWAISNESYGKSSYVAGSYQLEGIPERYFVIYGPSDNYLTDENTTVNVTVRNVTSKSTNYGFGLAVHGKVAGTNANDYAFLIITGDDPQFTIVLHDNGQTTTVQPWTKSSLIRTGTTPNELSVKLAAGEMTFSINGQLATSVKNSAGLSGGRIGLCLHDSYPVAFDDLEIYR